MLSPTPCIREKFLASMREKHGVTAKMLMAEFGMSYKAVMRHLHRMEDAIKSIPLPDGSRLYTCKNEPQHRGQQSLTRTVASGIYHTIVRPDVKKLSADEFKSAFAELVTPGISNANYSKDGEVLCFNSYDHGTSNHRRLVKRAIREVKKRRANATFEIVIAAKPSVFRLVVCTPFALKAAQTRRALKTAADFAFEVVLVPYAFMIIPPIRKEK